MPSTDTRTFTCNACGSSGSQRWMNTHNCEHNQYVREMGGRCEDYPCCGHTDGDGCYALESHTSEYWLSNPHLHCDHEAGICDADEPDDDDYDPGPEVDDEGGMSEYR